MSKVTLSQLAELTAKTWRTVRGRLQAGGIDPVEHSGKSALYASADALNAIYEIDRSKAGELDLQAERAALARAQRSRIELDLAARTGELLEASAVESWVADMISISRTAILNIPGELEQILPVADAQRVVPEVRRIVHQTLTDLAANADAKPNA